jgi:hypothetical protein
MERRAANEHGVPGDVSTLAPRATLVQASKAHKVLMGHAAYYEMRRLSHKNTLCSSFVIGVTPHAVSLPFY